LRDLGIGLHRIGQTLALALVLAGVQFAITLWGYQLPRPVDWVPLLVMSLVVGAFEAVVAVVVLALRHERRLDRAAVSRAAQPHSEPTR